jgi:glutamate-1-semialdehyde 2,1-aminomutase
LADGLKDIMTQLRIPHLVQHVGPMISLFLTTRAVEKFTDYRAVRRYCDFDRYIRLQHELQRRGVYFHPNQFEPMFLSTAHNEALIDETLERIEAGARRCLTA